MKKSLFIGLAFCCSLYIYITQSIEMAEASNIKNDLYIHHNNKMCENKCNDEYNSCMNEHNFRCAEKFEICLSSC